MLNGFKNSRGLELIRRHVDGESLNEDEIQAMRATMYLITCYIEPQRAWSNFKWRGPEYFVAELWPLIRERQELLTGQFGHGAISP